MPAYREKFRSPAQIFEAHITIPRSHSSIGELVAAAGPQNSGVLKWKTSAIDGDPLLGEKVFFYLTAHNSNYGMLHYDLNKVVDALRNNGATVLREKIELIMHDVRYEP